MIKPKPRSFRSSFFRPFAITLTVALWVAIAYMVDHQIRSPYAVNWERVATHLIEFTCFVTLLVVFNNLYFTVQVSDAGLRSYHFGGSYYTYSWEEIDWVRPFELPGLQYLLVGNKASNIVIIVPRFLSDKQRFQEEITRLAGENHPLVKAWNA